MNTITAEYEQARRELQVKICKYLAVIACVAGVVYLADAGKEGWGWLIFLALCLL